MIKTITSRFLHQMVADLKTKNGDIGRLLLGIFIDGLAVGMILTHIPLMLEHNGETSRVIGWVAGAISLSIFFTSPWVGRLTNHFGMGRTVIAAGLINSIFILAMAWSQDPLYWGVLRFLSGGVVAIRWLGMEVWINHLAEKHNRGRIMTLYTTIFSISVGLGSGLTGYIFLLGLLPYIIIALLQWLSMIPLARMKHKNIVPTAAENRRNKVKPNAKKKDIGFLFALKDNPILLLVAMASGIMFGASSMIAVQTIKQGFNPEQASTLISFYFAGPAMLFPLIGYMVNQITARQLIATSGMLAALAAWPAFYSGHYPTMIVFIIFYGVMEMTIYSSLLSALGHEYRGAKLVAMNGLVITIYSATSMVASPLAGEMMKRLGLVGLPMLMMMIGLIGMLVLFNKRKPT